MGTEGAGWREGVCSINKVGTVGLCEKVTSEQRLNKAESSILLSENNLCKGLETGENQGTGSGQ